MPLRTEHAARQLPPEKFIRFFRRYLAPAVVAIIGVDRRGTLRIQSVRFHKGRFTPDQARSWLGRNGFRTEVESAVEEGPPQPDAAPTF